MQETENDELAGSKTAPLPKSSPSFESSVARYVGYALVLAFVFFELPPTDVTYYPPFFRLSTFDTHLWLGSAFLLFPACCLLGCGFARSLSVPIERIAATVRDVVARGPVAVTAALFAVGLLAARLGNLLILRDYPLTDDEYAVKFGGQVLASGHVTMPLIEPAKAIPSLFFYVHDGRYTSMDWVGVQVAWALGELTGLGGELVFAAAAALALVAVALVVARKFGAIWGALGALYFAASPMAASLSITTHGHLLSRAFLGVALYFYVVARETSSRWRWAACGFALAVALTCRPFETVFLVLPFGLELIWSAVRGDRAIARGIFFVVAGALLPLALFALHSWAVTGNPLFPARLSGDAQNNVLPDSPPLTRLRENVLPNLLLLAIWFLGPLGCVLVAAGALVDRLSRLLALGVASVLGLAIFHLNTGIHIVGPIHYSECAVPLAVLAVYGTRAIKEWFAMHGASFAAPAAAIAFATVLGCGAFTVVNSIGLSRQTDIQEGVYSFIDRSVDTSAGKVVVLAPTYVNVWYSMPQYHSVGSWVFEWRRPHPDFSDRVLILHDGPGFESILRARFPDRRFYRLFPAEGLDDVRIQELPAPGAAAPAS